MHNSFFLFRNLAPELERRLRGFTWVSCFSQERDEAVLEFNDGKESFFIRVLFSPSLSVMTFPASFRRARKNAADLFSEALMQRVTAVLCFPNERSLLMNLTGGWSLLFKMHGPSGNLVLFENNRAIGLFRKRFTADAAIDPQAIGRVLAEDRDYFDALQENLKAGYFTFGREVWTWLDLHGFPDADTDRRWELLSETFRLLRAPETRYHIVRFEGRIWFTMLPFGEILSQWYDPVEALREFASVKIRDEHVVQRKDGLLRRLGMLIQQTDAFLNRTRSRLDEVSRDGHFQTWGDLIMANMHRVGPGETVLRAEDFYMPGHWHEIRLNASLTPQKNAENYYRKARNRASEVQVLEETIRSRENRLSEWRQLVEQVNRCDRPSDLDALETRLPSRQTLAESSERLPFTEYECMGFRILVGKSAADNDSLTFQYGFKEDLWLHARDCPGSHVLVKYRSGSPFPKPVIERAAALAAWHSKRKGEALCPVSWIARKFVRKRKGDPPGAVVLDRENVLMVPPAP